MPADVGTTLFSWSSTSSSNNPSGSTSISTNLDDNLREIQGVVTRWLSHKGADIASAATTDIGAVDGLMHDITGTVTITSLGTVRAGIWKVLQFDSALTLTHNATSLVLPGGANITTATGDVAVFISEGSGNWRCVSYQRASNATAFSDIKQAATTTATGVVELATAAETLTGTDTTRAITPDAFAGNKSLAASGYYKLPGGLIVQWGTVTTDAVGDATWTFPTAFASSVFCVLGTSNTGDAAITVTTGTATTTSVPVYTRNHADSQVSVSVLVFAVGV